LVDFDLWQFERRRGDTTPGATPSIRLSLLVTKDRLPIDAATYFTDVLRDSALAAELFVLPIEDVLPHQREFEMATRTPRQSQIE
jgi:hypothetical protein